MSKSTNIIAVLKNAFQQIPSKKIIGKNIFAKKIFEFLCREYSLHEDIVFFCTKDGLILGSSMPLYEEDFLYKSISIDKLRLNQYDLSLYNNLADYFLIGEKKESLIPTINNIQRTIDIMLKILNMYESNNTTLLHSLDSVQNSISIYDKDAHLLFANTNFCKYIGIEDRDSVTGMNITDVLSQVGVKISSIDDKSNQLKMLEVLKNGKEVLDWEVRLESSKKPNLIQLASNDMYPVINMKGDIEGMVEISRSRQQNMKRTRKILGLSAEYSFEDIIGDSPALRDKIRQAKEFADNPFSFLVTGESGVGKELFVQSIHNYSSRRNGPFVALNCANFPEALIESELFGYVSGAFTGASKNGQTGKFELADGGTLFLDEIGELPYHFQSKLLRVLETWTITRIGSTQEIPVNVRLIAATNRNLEEMIAEGLFRQDLYYRLQVLNVEIPPLRDRGSDVLLLSNAFLHQYAETNHAEPKVLDASAEQALLTYDWPGNVRELRNVINRVSILSKSNVITKDVIEASIYSKNYMIKNNVTENTEDRLQRLRLEINQSYLNLLKEALDITNGNKKKAAELIGVSRKTFYRMLEKYDTEENSGSL